MTILPFDNSDFVWGAAGLPGTGLTAGEKTTINSRLDGLEALTPPTVLSDLTDADTAGVASGDLLQYDGAEWVPYTPEPITITTAAAYSIDGGGAAITSGVKGDFPPFAFAGTITGVVGLADVSGTGSVQVWKDTIANYPPTVADLLATITITGATRSTVSTTSYTAVSHAFSAGDVIRLSVPSTMTTITRFTVGLRIEYEVGP